MSGHRSRYYYGYCTCDNCNKNLYWMIIWSSCGHCMASGVYICRSVMCILVYCGELLSMCSMFYLFIIWFMCKYESVLSRSMISTNTYDLYGYYPMLFFCWVNSIFQRLKWDYIPMHTCIDYLGFYIIL